MLFKVKKLSIKGAGEGVFKGKRVFIWGALPSEEVEAEIVKRKRRYFEAVVVKVLKSSKFRVSPQEDHFLSCSPWQIVDYKRENELKKELALGFIKKNLGLEFKDVEIMYPEVPFGYRNKMEYQLVERDGKISLAYGKRGRKEKIAIEGCLLADKRINEKAVEIVNFLNENGFEASMLKTLMLRIDSKGDVFAALFTFLSKDNFSSMFPNFEEKLDLKGFSIYYSTPLSPASVVTDVIYTRGDFRLEWVLFGKKFHYGFFSFFQINPLIFEKAVKDIYKFVQKGDKVIDFYSGVGVIGIAVADKSDSVLLVEIDEEAVKYAEENIKLNGLSNVEVIASAAESALQFIEQDSTVILDPARSGLHKKVVKQLLRVKPKRIIYLSCNIETQVRDVGFLLREYKISFFKLYNFFPRTPHVESLMVLERRK